MPGRRAVGVDEMWRIPVLAGANVPDVPRRSGVDAGLVGRAPGELGRDGGHRGVLEAGGADEGEQQHVEDVPAQQGVSTDLGAAQQHESISTASVAGSGPAGSAEEAGSGPAGLPPSRRSVSRSVGVSRDGRVRTGSPARRSSTELPVSHGRRAGLSGARSSSRSRTIASSRSTPSEIPSVSRRSTSSSSRTDVVTSASSFGRGVGRPCSWLVRT
jgi:hypothetical protein